MLSLLTCYVLLIYPACRTRRAPCAAHLNLQYACYTLFFWPCSCNGLLLSTGCMWCAVCDFFFCAVNMTPGPAVPSTPPNPPCLLAVTDLVVWCRGVRDTRELSVPGAFWSRSFCLQALIVCFTVGTFTCMNTGWRASSNTEITAVGTASECVRRQRRTKSVSLAWTAANTARTMKPVLS